MISNHFFVKLAGRFELPRNYAVVDIETSGLSPERNLICSIGYTVVRDCKVVSTEEDYLDWSQCPDVDHDQLQQDLSNVERVMTAQGKGFFHTWDKLKRDGQPPEEMLNKYLLRFEELEANREILVSHGGYRFDLQFFAAAFHNFLRVGWDWDPELVVDTGILIKSAQLEDHDEPLPLAGETFLQWAHRIGSLRRRGVFWALDKFCEEEFGLCEKVGGDLTQAHGAGFDSRLTHALFEEIRKLTGLV